MKLFEALNVMNDRSTVEVYCNGVLIYTGAICFIPRYVFSKKRVIEILPSRLADFRMIVKKEA